MTPLIQLIKAHQQIDQRRFPGTGRTDDRHRLSRFDVDVHVFNQQLFAVTEVDMLERNGSLGFRQDDVSLLP